jgi:hypothetical protein
MRGSRDDARDLRDALAGAAEVAGDGSSCPDAERLVSSARGELPHGENEEVVLHLAECTCCASAWRVAREVVGDQATAGRAGPARPALAGWGRWAAAAAVLIAAAGAGFLYLGPGRDSAPVYREQHEDIVESRLAEAEPLPRDAFVLRWSAMPEGSLYDVVVTDERMRTLDETTGLTRNEYLVPPPALERQASGDRVFWQVTARLPDGRKIESTTFFARVR